MEHELEKMGRSRMRKLSEPGEYILGQVGTARAKFLSDYILQTISNYAVL